MRPSRPATRRRLAAALVCAAVAMTIAPAQASTGERELAGSLLLDGSGRIGAALSSAWWWSDLVAFGAALDGSFTVADATLPHRLAARGEVRVAIDALTWVPWLELGAGYGVHPEVWSGGLLLRAGAGVAYRSSRAFSWQARVAWERLAVNRGGDTLQLCIGFAWHRGGAGTLDF